MQAFYKWLRAEGEVTENPVDRISPPRVPESIQPHYTAEDIERVLKALRGRRSRGLDAARSRAIVLVLYDTGVRASELCGSGDVRH